METRPIPKELLPVDKSWLMRMGMLDLASGREDIIERLDERRVLADDLRALRRAVSVWKEKQEIDVGESGTLYRFLQFLSWKNNADKTFFKQGTLMSRSIAQDPTIVSLSQKALLLLDNGTSQWASAAALFGDEERVQNPPYKLQLTYDAIRHWRESRQKEECWLVRGDETMKAQAEHFLVRRKGLAHRFVPEQAEDYCFARAFGYMNAEEGERRWPSLRTHETDRIMEMERALVCLRNEGLVDSMDHRVVQAMVLLGELRGIAYRVAFPHAVNKSWPEFWDFVSWARAR